MLFLKFVGAHQYGVIDAYHPSLPATGAIVSGSVVADEVASVECGVMASDEMVESSRLESIWGLRGLDATCIRPSLRALISHRVRTVTLTAEQALMQRGDIEALPSAISDALSSTDDEPSYLKSNVLYAIGTGVHEPAAIKMLDPLLKSQNPEARLAAARALNNIGTPDCIPVLRKLTVDANQDIRYQAVIGLADITGTVQMHPSIPEFRANERKYTEHWRPQ